MIEREKQLGSIIRHSFPVRRGNIHTCIIHFVRTLEPFLVTYSFGRLPSAGEIVRTESVERETMGDSFLAWAKAEAEKVFGHHQVSIPHVKLVLYMNKIFS